MNSAGGEQRTKKNDLSMAEPTMTLYIPEKAVLEGVKLSKNKRTSLPGVKVGFSYTKQKTNNSV